MRMKLSDLSFRVFSEIIELYDKTVGGHGSYYLEPHNFDDLLQRLCVSGRADWRIGSKITGHSKLCIDLEYRHSEPLISFRFHPNIAGNEDPNLAEELKKKFEQAVDDFLKKRGLAVEE